MYDYNTNRKPLILKEYGRNVQRLVEQIDTIEDKAARTKQAKAIMKLMAILNASNKQAIENLQKRWDDLYIMSNYSLDVDSPYPMPEQGALNKKPQQLEYAKKPVRFKNYGRNVERLIQKAVNAEDPEVQEKMVIVIAKLMKTFSNVRNGDNLDCDTILANIQHITGNKLMLDFEKIKAQNIFHVAHKERNGANQDTTNRKKIT